MGPLSLITNRATKIHVYSASKIPRPPSSAQPALLPGAPQDNTGAQSAHRDEVNRYVSYAFHSSDSYGIPDEDEFKQKMEASLNVKTKFSLLEDVADGKFCDLIVQIVRQPFDGGDKITLYASDYTENAHFFNYTYDKVMDIASRNGDPYGYTRPPQSTPNREQKDTWIGPYGKRAMQITCFEPHCNFVRQHISAGHWVLLNNVQVKFGRDNQNLEGFLREERNFPAKVNVGLLDTTDRKTADPRVVDAIRRWREYNKEKNQQVKQIQAAEAAGQKRKQALSSVPSDNEEPNTKQGRVQKKKKRDQKKRRERRESERLKAAGEHPRAAQQQAQDGAVIRAEENHDSRSLVVGINKAIKSEDHRVSLTSIAFILEPVHHEATIGGEGVKIELPFVCAKYQAQVRVVDFFPNSLADFAVYRKHTEFDLLSDNDSTDDDDDDGESLSDASVGETSVDGVWEWRFALQLEDANVPGQRLWALVDNAEAQALTGLDASDLRKTPGTLDDLRERMFLLWGNLEETKAAVAGQAGKHRPPAKKRAHLHLSIPPDSSDQEDSARWETSVSNKPFICCLRQYGVKDRRGTSSRGKEAAGPRWTRVFGLFGTKISYDGDDL